MINKTFWQWAGYAGLGILTWFYLPARIRPIAIFVLLLGAIVFVQKQRGGLAAIATSFRTGGKG